MVKSWCTMIQKIPTFLLAFFQATGLVCYIVFVALFMSNYSPVMSGADPVLSGVTFLLLFVVSASASAFLVFGRAAYLFWEKRYKEAFSLGIFTLLWAFFYFLLLVFFGNRVFPNKYKDFNRVYNREIAPLSSPSATPVVEQKTP